MSCPCGLGESIDTCCGPYLSGAQLPETAEQLMRSRYTAFATGNTQYILDTCHPDMAEKPELKDIEQWSKGSTWLGFELRGTERGQAGDKEGVVEFVAKYRAGNQTIHHREASEFKKVDGRWYFAEGHELPQEPIKNDLKNIGRNDPCPCGSGKKFKKCCWGNL